jgi:uncharacterized protein YjbJ (UPF0337 family)
MKIIKILFKSCLVSVLLMSGAASAVETNAEKAETVVNKSVDKVKSAARDMDNKVCEMIDGKMKCVVTKIKNKLKNAQDTTKTKATEIKNKIDGSETK